MKITQLNSLIAIILGITVLSFSFTILADDAYALRNADRDYDGIVDEDDQCPQIAETFNKFEDEDGCPDTVIEEKTKYEFPDTDGDGFEDRIDNCPNLPETFNDYLDHDGCPEKFAKTTDMEKDSDGDSVPDSIDACPTEKETINEFKDGDGCPDSLEPSYSKTGDFDDEQCRGEKIAVMRVHTEEIVCVDLNTAERWEGYGLGKILVKSEPANGNLVVSGAEMMKDLAKLEETKDGEIDYASELTLVPQVDGGDRALTVTPVIGTPDREFSKKYVAGTEELREDEMRITFCGTGMPYPVYQQAAACVIVELGNDDVFLFDLGADSISRVNGMGIDTNKLNKIFIGHLHTDHIGDLAILWSQGGFTGRSVPLEVFGPSGPDHSMGIAYYVENMLESNKWDLENRKAGIPVDGMRINTHEFDFSKTQVIYEENGVTVTSFPAIHGLDGAVSFRLDWNDLSFVFSSDTKPNKFLVENSQNVDILIHEGFIPAESLNAITGMPLETATWVSEEVHTPPDGAGVVYDMTQPRLAVLYHVILTQEVVTESFELLRTTYDGPALYAEDLVTINVTPDYIVSRPTEIIKNAYPEYRSAEGEVKGSEYGISDWLYDAKIDWKSYKEEKLKETP